MNFLKKLNKRELVFCLLLFSSLISNAQTDFDAIMMTKNNICSGVIYSRSSWTEYWEGTNKRTNANLGRVSANMYSVMANYGITDKLNIIVGLPYVTTKASAGQLHPMQGLQDASLWVKWEALAKQLGKGDFSLYAIGGYSLPASGYSADFQPLSLGLGSKNLSLRGLVDYQVGDWFATASATYVRRSNISIDKPAYYTTEMHYTNEVKMPDAAQFNFRAGLRNGVWIAEVTASNWTTLGGFDITKNNSPFPSNKILMTTVGARFKYEPESLKGLSFIGGTDYTVAGRNVGQSTSFNAGLFYVVNLRKHHSSNKQN